MSANPDQIKATPQIDMNVPMMLLKIGSYFMTQAIHVVVKLDIPDLLADGPLGVAEIAERTGTDERALYRVLRLLASQDIFAETEDGRFELTELAETLRSDRPDSLRPMALMHGEPWHWRPWGNLMHSVRTGEPAFDEVFGKGIFDYFENDDPEAGRVFDAAMNFQTQFRRPAVLDAVDFGGIRRLVDVGGGHGWLLGWILERYPDMQGVLFDRGDVVEGARRHFEEIGVADRCEAVSGDFFEAVPEGDAIILGTIIHDWDDESSTRILASCRRAIADDGRLFLVENVLPGRNEPGMAKILDVEMLVMQTGRERSEDEYRELLRAAGFELKQVTMTPAGEFVLESAPA